MLALPALWQSTTHRFMSSFIPSSVRSHRGRTTCSTGVLVYRWRTHVSVVGGPGPRGEHVLWARWGLTLYGISELMSRWGRFPTVSARPALFTYLITRGGLHRSNCQRDMYDMILKPLRLPTVYDCGWQQLHHIIQGTPPTTSGLPFALTQNKWRCATH
jgi:hypothetical protein